MAELLVFHHAQGLTAGVHAFADELRRAGHRIHTPDLYDGRTFATLADGLACAEAIDDAGAEWFLYPGDRHLFTDASLGVHDPAATAQLTRRVLDFVAAR